MEPTRYGFGIKLEGVSFGDAVGRVTNELKKEGFGILSEIDVKATLKKKLDVDFRNYLILGACNPPLAKKALEAEPQIGLLLPCNVVVQDAIDGSGVIVSFADPQAMFTMVDNKAVAGVAQEADQRLRRVMAALQS